MTWVVQNIQNILLITGVITASVGLLFLVPKLGLGLMFKEGDPSPLLVFVFRHWAVLVGVLGGLLIAAAYEPALRVPVIIAAGAEKAVLVALVLSHLGRTNFAKWALPPAIIDAVSVLLYLMYLSAATPA